jgi:hypothetical protein
MENLDDEFDFEKSLDRFTDDFLQAIFRIGLVLNLLVHSVAYFLIRG